MVERIVSSRKQPDGEGKLVGITPAQAGWNYVGFEVYSLRKGQTWTRKTEEMEACVVLLSGLADAATSRLVLDNIGGRMSIFEGTPPYSVYVPSYDTVTMTARTDLEFAVCLAPGRGDYPTRLIAPEEVGVEIRGYGNMERRIHNILPEQKEAGSLLVVEVFTPGGHWSSYPPHKHDKDDLPHESYLEETYYHRINPAHGFALQRVYTDDRSLDEAMAVKDGDVVLVPRGYHPVSAPPGYDVYYLNVMAGPVRTWKFRNDPDHEWLITRGK
jgi:5-deoxy-glucuronate isomerase